MKLDEIFIHVMSKILMTTKLPNELHMMLLQEQILNHLPLLLLSVVTCVHNFMIIYNEQRKFQKKRSL